MPRYLQWVVLDILEPRYITLNVSLCLAILCYVPKRRDSVFPLFRLITRAFWSSQSAMTFKSVEIFDLITLISLSATQMTVSSAYLMIFALLITSVTLRNIMNNREPTIEPCGTPVRTSFALDRQLSQLTTTDRLKR